MKAIPARLYSVSHSPVPDNKYPVNPYNISAK